ncbi:MAG TPA: TonB-dependent receptor [Sphingobium sp.]
MKNCFLSTVALAALILPGAARADDSEAADTSTIIVLGHPSEGLDISTGTGSRLGLTILDTPASIEVLTGDVIRGRGDLSIVDAVTRATGISTSANPGNGGTGLAARGFNGQGSVMILYDGVRLYPGAGTVTFPTDPWTVDRIEVLRGPASVLYGQGAIGGAVNVISRKPSTDATHFDAEAGYGSQDSWRVGAGVGGPVNDVLSYRIDASRTQSDGWVERGGSKGVAISGALRFAPSEDFSLTLSNDYSNQKPSRYFGTPLIDGKLDDRNKRLNYNATDAVIHYKDNRTTLKAEWDLADGVALTSTAYRLTTDRRWRNLESYCWVAANGFCPNEYNVDPFPAGEIYRTDYLGIDHKQTQVGNQTTLAVSRPIAGLKNDLVVGFDINRIKFKHFNNFSLVSDNSVDPFVFDPGLFDDSVPVAAAYRTRTRQYSIFAEDRLSLTDELSLVAGINYEHANVKRYNIAADGTELLPTGFTADGKTLSNTTWRVGAVYQPTPTLSLYAQYATAVDPLGSLVTFSPKETQFKNTTGDQVEAGIKATFLEGRGNFTFAAYRIVKKNLLVRNPADLTDTTPLQVGQRSAKGLEASLTLDLPQGFGIEANGSILEAQFDEFHIVGTAADGITPRLISYNGNTPPNVPETTANLWLRYDPLPRLRTRAGLRYVGRTFSDNANAFRVPGYTVVDAGISYAFTDNLAANVRVYNLFDKDYATNAYNDQQWILGRPRSIDVSVTAHF